MSYNQEALDKLNLKQLTKLMREKRRLIIRLHTVPNMDDTELIPSAYFQGTIVVAGKSPKNEILLYDSKERRFTGEVSSSYPFNHNLNPELTEAINAYCRAWIKIVMLGPQVDERED